MNPLSQELLLMQQSRCTNSYQEFLEEIPEKINKQMVKPLNKFNLSISKLVKHRGKMLFLLDQKVSRLFKSSS